MLIRKSSRLILDPLLGDKEAGRKDVYFKGEKRMGEISVSWEKRAVGVVKQRSQGKARG